MAREVGEVALPDGIRRSQLYQNLVDATLRYLIEQVGGVEGVYSAEEALPDDFLARRTAGNAVEVLGIVAFRASPVWVLAALADLCGMGRHLIPEIADALKAQGLLEQDAAVHQRRSDAGRSGTDLVSAGRPRSTRRRSTSRDSERNGRPFGRKPGACSRRVFPPGTRSATSGRSSRTESARQDRSIFETSSVMAVSAARALPGGVRWLSASARVGATRTGQIFAAALLDHYRQTLSEIQDVGYMAYANRLFRPYVRAAVNQFSPGRRTSPTA